LHRRGDREPAFAHVEQTLRAHDARYYRVGPLPDAAKLQVDRGRIEEAAELTREAAGPAGELELREEIIRSQALEATIIR
jgi:hypothetical protein